MAHIIRPYKEIELKQKQKVSGSVRLKTVNKEGRVIRSLSFDNIVTDEFRKYGFWGADSDSNGFNRSLGIAVGAGVQTTPQVTDTALGNKVDVMPLDSGVFFGEGVYIQGPTPDDDFVQWVTTTTFDYPRGNGDLTELGLVVNRQGTVASDANYADLNLLTRALIRDGSGNPAVLTKTDSEQLIIEYELRFYRGGESFSDFNVAGQDIRILSPAFKRSDVVTDPRDLLDLNIAKNIADRGNSSTAGVFDRLAYAARYTYTKYDSYAKSMKSMGLSLHQPEGLTHKFYWRVAPDAVDQSLNSMIRSSSAYFDYDTTSANPAICSAVASADNLYANAFLILDPSTNQSKQFNLPAGYRLDFEFGLEWG